MSEVERQARRVVADLQAGRRQSPLRGTPEFVQAVVDRVHAILKERQ